MILSKKFILKPNKTESIILKSLSFASAKLWNIANYEKRNYKKLGFEKYPNWYDQKKRFKSEYWYKSLPSQTAQETLNMLEKSWKPFSKLKIELNGDVHLLKVKIYHVTNLALQLLTVVLFILRLKMISLYLSKHLDHLINGVTFIKDVLQ